MNSELKGKLQDVGCIIWVVLVVVLPIAGGWFAHDKWLSHLVWMAPWVSIVLSILAGIVILLVLCVISWLILIWISPEWDMVEPDYPYP